MGNRVSGNANDIKVVLPTNEVLRIDGQAKAAELMLDMPGNFLVSSRSMQVGKRFMALSADDELEMSCVYVMFPMKRVKDMVDEADMARLFIVANNDVRRSSGGGAKVRPDTSNGDYSPKKPKLEDLLKYEALNEEEKRAMEVWIIGGTKPKLEELLKEEALNEEEERATELEELRQRISVYRARRPRLETIPEEVISSR